MTDAEANDDFRGSQLFHWLAESIKTRLQVAGNVEHSSRWFVDASAASESKLNTSICPRPTGTPPPPPAGAAWPCIRNGDFATGRVGPFMVPPRPANSGRVEGAP